MKRLHFETIQPVCPQCRAFGRSDSPLRISCVAREDDLDIVEGILQCDHPECLREFPIIDGLPILVADVPSFVQNNFHAIHGREDLTELTTSVLSDCCGPSSPYDVTRQHLSSYVWDHYGDLAPIPFTRESDALAANAPQPGGVVRALEDTWRAAGRIARGPILDIGCSVGRTAFELAEDTDDLVLGVDLNYAMLRWASQVLHRSRVKFDCREVGVVYRSVEYEVRFPRKRNVDFWVCDAMALPFRPNAFANAVALNVLDCVASPLDFLAGVGDLLPPGGKALLTTPFDWSPSATPMCHWLGGHSNRDKDAGQSEAVIRRALATEDARKRIGLKLIDAGEAPPWHVRLHARSTMLYRNHRLVLEAVAKPKRSGANTTGTIPTTMILPATPESYATVE